MCGERGLDRGRFIFPNFNFLQNGHFSSTKICAYFNLFSLQTTTETPPEHTCLLWNKKLHKGSIFGPKAQKLKVAFEIFAPKAQKSTIVIPAYCGEKNSTKVAFLGRRPKNRRKHLGFRAVGAKFLKIFVPKAQKSSFVIPAYCGEKNSTKEAFEGRRPENRRKHFKFRKIKYK